MFKLSIEYIKENSSDFAYSRGQEYHHSNRVRSIQYNPHKRIFTATVFDLKDRNISVTFDAEGRLAASQCSCRLPGKAARSFCEHIVTVLLLIQKRDNEGFFSNLIDREKAKRFFDLFAYPQSDEPGESRDMQIRLEPIYVLPNSTSQSAATPNLSTAPSLSTTPSLSASSSLSTASNLPAAPNISTAQNISATPNLSTPPMLDAVIDGAPLGEGGYGNPATEYNSRFFFRISTGTSSYMIKSISRLLWSLSRKRPFDFSKKFSFDPSRHTLNSFDAQICDYLLEIYESAAVHERAYATGSTINPDMYKDKFLCLTDRQFRRILDIYVKNGKPLQVSASSVLLSARILDEPAPLSFHLERDDNDIILHVGTGSDLLPLTGNGDIVFCGNRIFRLPKPQAGIMRSFLDMLGSYRESDFRFVSEDRGRFVSEVLPAIERIGSLAIDDEVSAIIERKPLTADIYLDREDAAVTADVRFRYGETEINPFMALPKAKRSDANERIVVRDMPRENEILDILAESNFKVKNGKINLYDDDSIFGFVIDILPQLQKYADVYYSQEFRRMSVKRSIGFRANLSFIIREAGWNGSGGGGGSGGSGASNGSGGGSGASSGGGGGSGGSSMSEFLSFDFDTDGIDRSELIEIMRGIREKKRYYKLKDGSLLNLSERESQDITRLMDVLDARDEDIISGHITLPSYRALYIDYYLRSSEIRNIGRDRILREFIRSIREPAESEFSPPTSVAQVLRDYQRTGFKWLKALSAYSLGGILADDMGLGKTLQVLVLLLSAREEAAREVPAAADAMREEARREVPVPAGAADAMREEAAREMPAAAYAMREEAAREVPAPAGAADTGAAGALAAADMGTAATGAAIPYVSLIIAPTSLIYNWCAEIEKFTPGLKYLAVAGAKADRVKLIASIPGHDVVITSYPLIRRDYDEYRRIAFRYCILDEAQYIKNPNSQNALSVKCLRAKSRFALTGTPIENHLMDLWSIFDFVLPGYLLTARAFYRKYMNASAAAAAANVNAGTAAMASGASLPAIDNQGVSDPDGQQDYDDIEPDGQQDYLDGETGSGQAYDDCETGDVQSYDDGAKAYDGGGLETLFSQIRPFILRRLKADVLRELPDKIDTRMYAQMTDEQKKVYLVYLEKTREQLEAEIGANGFEKSQIIILAALTRLRQICCHPALFIDNYEYDSGKLLLLQEVIREAIGGGHRILLFSQFTSMLAIIRTWADKERLGYHYIDGQTKPFDRHRMINEFNSGSRDIFLLSLKAGGTGVNLTGADTVIHYDPWWNPAVEDQATDRAYRIGQQKTVQVIKLLTAGSIEEKIYAIQERKKHLIDAVIRPGETFLNKLSKADLDAILSPD